MDSDRRLWSQQQKVLRYALERPGDHEKAIELFLDQHTMVHSATMSESDLWSFEDEVLQGMTEESIRHIPQNCDHSLAWIIWHLARIEDITMNLLVAGRPQILYQDHWLDRIKTTIQHAGNVMDEESVANLSAAVDLEPLMAYRRAVGRRTREIVAQLQPEQLRQQVEPSRLQQVRDEGAVAEAAGEIIQYWSRRTIAGLLLMPPTRHNFLHLNEARRVKDRCS